MTHAPTAAAISNGQFLYSPADQLIQPEPRPAASGNATNSHGETSRPLNTLNTAHATTEKPSAKQGNSMFSSTGYSQHPVATRIFQIALQAPPRVTTKPPTRATG